MNAIKHILLYGCVLIVWLFDLEIKVIWLRNRHFYLLTRVFGEVIQRSERR